MRRFTRLTNAFSKKLRNLKAAVAFHFAHYNLCRVHQTLRCTPAMEVSLLRIHRPYKIADLRSAHGNVPSLLGDAFRLAIMLMIDRCSTP
jgi:hypothetical protein